MPSHATEQLDRAAPPLAADATTARRLAMVERLAEIGMAMAEGLLDEARQPDGRVQASGEIALSYSRVARAVRLSVMLAERVEADAAAQERAREAAEAPADLFSEERKRQVRLRMRLLVRRDAVREVSLAAILAKVREEGESVDVEGLLDGLGRLMESPEIDDLAWRERPLGELAARICADLGVTYDPRLWDEDLSAVIAAAEDAADEEAPPERWARVRAPPRWMGGPPAERRPP